MVNVLLAGPLHRRTSFLDGLHGQGRTRGRLRLLSAASPGATLPAANLPAASPPNWTGCRVSSQLEADNQEVLGLSVVAFPLAVLQPAHLWPRALLARLALVALAFLL